MALYTKGEFAPSGSGPFSAGVPLKTFLCPRWSRSIKRKVYRGRSKIQVCYFGNRDRQTDRQTEITNDYLNLMQSVVVCWTYIRRIQYRNRQKAEWHQKHDDRQTYRPYLLVPRRCHCCKMDLMSNNWDTHKPKVREQDRRLILCC